jgi:hypothetical protein
MEETVNVIEIFVSLLHSHCVDFLTLRNPADGGVGVGGFTLPIQGVFSFRKTAPKTKINNFVHFKQSKYVPWLGSTFLQHDCATLECKILALHAAHQ